MHIYRSKQQQQKSLQRFKLVGIKLYEELRTQVPTGFRQMPKLTKADISAKKTRTEKRINK